MLILTRIFGPPHEALHLLALWLIGRRAVAVSWTHVDIPDDLTTRQYVFVAGLPALVFWSMTVLALLAAVNAPDGGRLALALAATLVFGLAAYGTLGDLHLILLRLTEDRTDAS
ncbi:MAG: hypothetical protein HZC41_24365 [Chloroflexi bacterium]|nr:hypothetical protein [Chloroflexota bacterium]